MKKEELAAFVWDQLKEMYPDAACTLELDGDPFHLFVRGILSAQCTDKRVNEVTKGLFQKYPDAKAFAAATEEEIGKEIKSCGLYKTKAKGIVQSSRILLEQYDGKIPSDVKTLETFPSVGRKIANLISSEIYQIPAIVVDTHCGRVANRLGFTDSKVPSTIEKDLMKVFPKTRWISLGHSMVAHGRALCKAKNPDCENCLMAGACAYAKERNHHFG